MIEVFVFVFVSVPVFVFVFVWREWLGEDGIFVSAFVMAGRVKI